MTMDDVNRMILDAARRRREQLTEQAAERARLLAEYRALADEAIIISKMPQSERKELLDAWDESPAYVRSIVQGKH